MYAHGQNTICKSQIINALTTLIPQSCFYPLFMKTKFFMVGLVMAAAFCLLSCNNGQNYVLSGVHFENYSSMREVADGKAINRSEFILPAGDVSFGKQLYSEKTICFDDGENHDGINVETCTAIIYEHGVSIEVNGHKSFFDAKGMEMMPTDHEFTVTAMPSSIPGAPWQPATVLMKDGSSIWYYTSLYNKGDYAHREEQKIKGWYWEYAKQKGYQYNVLLLE